MNKKIFTIILLILSIITVTGCGKKDKYSDKIKSFKYSFGSFNGGYIDYEIYKSDKKTMIKIEGYNGKDIKIEKEIPESDLEEISKIILDKKIYNWNKFDESDNMILDGNSFSLNVVYNNDESIG